jgi:hypothetical protein
MSYYLYLIETKKEYTIHLINALAPIIYEGISSIYEDAKNNSSNGEELRLFQNLLRKIPSWNDYLIEQETNRIIKLSSKGEIVEDLIRAVIKSNIMILTNTPPENKDNLRIKHDITTQKFIHNSYMEVARNIFQNPYVFYHKYNSYQLKKNQRESTDIIKKSIEQSIRKLLPMNLVLQNYLGNTFEIPVDDFDNSIPDYDYNNLRNILNKDPVNNDEIFQLVKKNESISKLESNIVKQPYQEQNNILSFKIDMPKLKTNINSSDSFKSLKELVKQNISPIENKTNQILLTKTEQAIKESEIKKSEQLIKESEQLIKESEQLIKESEKKESEKKESEKKESEKKESEKKESEKKYTILSEQLIKESEKHIILSEQLIKKSDKKESNIKKSEKKESEKKECKEYDILSESIKDTIVKQDEYEKSKYIKSNINNPIPKLSKKSKNLEYDIDDDSSVSYFRQYENEEELAEVYNNHGTNIKSSDLKNIIDKSFVNYNQILNDNDDSSINLKSIMDNISSVDIKNNKQSTGNKNKYFNKNSNL